MARFTKILVISLAFVITSCDSLFETYPKDQLLEENFWLTEGDVESAVITGYYDLKRCQDELILYGLIRSDIVEPSNYEFVQYQKGIFASTDDICNWSRFYSLINSMNLVVEKSEAVLSNDPTFTKQKYNELVGEARFLRAFAYFNMIRMWKNIPVVTTPSLNDEQDYYPQKSTSPDEVFALIKEDVEFAMENLPEEYIIEDDKELSIQMTRGRVTRGAAHALASDVYLWLNEFDKCIVACDYILNSPLYVLMPAEQWFDNFHPQKGNTTESIFEINHQESFDYTDRHNASRWKYALEEWFEDRIKTQPISANWPQPDFRLYGTFMGSNFDQCRKHVGTSFGGSGLVGESYNPNWIVYRLPHIMFNKAEALNRAQGGVAQDEINKMVRTLEQRAGVLEYEEISGSVREVEEALLNYKMKETAFEGTRWFDLKRIGLRQWSENLTGDNNILVRSITAIVPEQDQIFTRGNLNNPENWNIPISKSELEANANLEQNPFYENN